MTKNFRPALLATAALIGLGTPAFAADTASGHAAARAQVATPSVSGSAAVTPRVTGTVQAPAAQGSARQAPARHAATPATPAHPTGQVTAPRPANGQAQAPVHPAAPAGTASTTPIPGAPRAN